MSTETDTTTGPKFPHVTVQLTGQDGNAFAILGATKKAMQRAGVDPADIEAYMAEATAGDYNHLLATTMNTVDVA